MKRLFSIGGSVLLLIGILDLLSHGLTSEQLDEIGQIRGWYSVVDSNRETPVRIIGATRPLESIATTNPYFHYLIIGCWFFSRVFEREHAMLMLAGAVIFIIASAYAIFPPSDFGAPEFPGFKATFAGTGGRNDRWYWLDGEGSDQLTGVCRTVESGVYLCRLRPDTESISTELALFARELRGVGTMTVAMIISQLAAES